MKELSDTHPDIRKRLIEGYRNMPVQQKLRAVGQMHQFARKLTLTDIRRRYPDADEQECLFRLAHRWFGADVANRVSDRRPKENSDNAQ
jgi:hypothetical protein